MRSLNTNLTKDCSNFMLLKQAKRSLGKMQEKSNANTRLGSIPPISPKLSFMNENANLSG